MGGRGFLYEAAPKVVVSAGGSFTSLGSEQSTSAADSKSTASVRMFASPPEYQ